jgi:dihydroxyacetone kinase-like predicted kinase
VVASRRAGLASCSSRPGDRRAGWPGPPAVHGQILEAVDRLRAAEVIVLPNDRDSVAVAEAAADGPPETGDMPVAVIPTDAQVQGLAALAVPRARPTFEQDIRRDDRRRPARPLRRA